MPAHRRIKQSRRLTTAGLITVSAATLLMMAWAIFPTAAFALQNISIDNGSLTSHGCDATEWHFIITQVDDLGPPPGNTDEAPATIHVTWANGNSADVPLAHTPGGTAHYHTTLNLGSTVTGATAVIYDSWSGVFTLSHGPCGGTTTTPTTTSTTQTTTTQTTTATTTTGTTTPGTSTTETTTSSTTTPGGSSTTPTETTETTTSESPTVSPTTVTPTSPDEVSPTTVTPGGTAFTGVENVVPIGAIALFLMTAGSGLLWAGGRFGKKKDEE